jgi:ankyrin repeat protein
MSDALTEAMKVLEKYAAMYIPLFEEGHPKSLDERGGDDDALMHKLVCWNAVDDAAVLLRDGADVNAKGEDSFTDIQYAVQFDKLEMAKLLMSFDARDDATNDFAENARKIAKRKNMIEFLSVLELKYGAI